MSDGGALTFFERARGRATLARWGPAAVALVLALAAYAPALHPERRLAGRDLLVLFEPLHRRVAEAWREGRLPERDPYRGCGTPTVPDPLAQVLYPPALLRAALPFDLGWALWFPLHAALAGAGAAHLARRLGASPRAAAADRARGPGHLSRLPRPTSSPAPRGRRGSWLRSSTSPPAGARARPRSPPWPSA
ncbi:MAG: hypothetical protein KF878_24705 [Planctomycetes bacterium]|nr:hypothetical protein [Planctomycetota bacterium]